MKEQTQAGIGSKVHKAQVLNVCGKDILWNFGLLGTYCPEVLLTTVMFTIGLSCSLRAGKEHYNLCSIPFDSHFTFLRDHNRKLYFCYCEDIGLKTNKGGIKHRKIDPKVVDVYQISNAECCPVRILYIYESVTRR